MKKCSRCLETKSLFDFNKNKTTKDGLQFYCKSCRKTVCASSFQKISKEQKQARNASSKQWKENNKEQVKAYAIAYSKKNTAKRTALERKRELAKKNRTPSWLTPFDLLHMQCLYQVAAMRTKESGQQWHVDHIVPLQGKTVSGLHVPWNLQVILASENLRKNNKHEI